MSSSGPNSASNIQNGITINSKVSSSGDDGFATIGSSLSTSTPNVFIYDGSSNSYHGFVKFNNINIPQGAKILSAKLIFKTYSSRTVGDGITIKFNDEDNAVAPTTISEFNSLTTTTEVAYYDPGVSSWVDETIYETGDISNVIQEVIDRAGWSEGNSMMAIIYPNSTSYNQGLDAYSYDGDSDNCFELEITYSTEFGLTSWSNPSNAGASDNSYATFQDGGVSGIESYYLGANNFGFSIPAGATINGILVEVEKKYTSGNSGDSIEDSVARIVKGGLVGSTNKAQAGSWSTTESYYSYGGASDLWGETWTASDINSTNFGFALAALGYSGLTPRPTASIDHIRITVYYTESGTQTNSERTIQTSGIATTSSERVITTKGKDTDQSERTIELEGIIGADEERLIQISGKDTTNSERLIELTGGLTDSNERGIELIGTATPTDERNIEVTGLDERGGCLLQEDGFIFTQEDGNCILTEDSPSGNDRGIELTGQLLDNDERGVEVSGVLFSASERGVEITGEASSSSERNIETTGKASASSERGIELSGIIISTAERTIGLTGKDTTQSELGIELIGGGSFRERDRGNGFRAFRNSRQTNRSNGCSGRLFRKRNRIDWSFI